MDLLIVIFRTLFFYFFILACLRIMGKREVGQLSISDLTISILIAELVAISIENRSDNTLLTILPIVLLVVLEISLSYLQMKNYKLKRIIDGKPSVIIDHGILNINEMVKQRYSVSDLLISLRDKNIESISDVDYALLESNGKLSVFKKNVLIKKDIPLPLIIDGHIEKDTLKSINKSEEWVKRIFKSNDLAINHILYAFYKNNKIYIVKSTY